MTTTNANFTYDIIAKKATLLHVFTYDDSSNHIYH